MCSMMKLSFTHRILFPTSILATSALTRRRYTVAKVFSAEQQPQAE
jgi:hypothetical protein